MFGSKFIYFSTRLLIIFLLREEKSACLLRFCLCVGGGCWRRCSCLCLYTLFKCICLLMIIIIFTLWFACNAPLGSNEKIKWLLITFIYIIRSNVCYFYVEQINSSWWFFWIFPLYYYCHYYDRIILIVSSFLLLIT